MSHLVTKTLSHSRAVCSAYKRAYRLLESTVTRRHDFRYEAVKLRAQFDANAKIVDPRVAKQLLDDAEKELWRLFHLQMIQFPTSPGGVAYQRDFDPPDMVLDYWHPLEKAQFPKYFATREKRKIEYMEMYERQQKELQDKQA